MKTLSIFLILIVALIVNSCSKEYLNPYDRECPPEIWTPDSLQASLIDNKIVISWVLSETHFDGFVLEKSTDSILWSSVIDGLISNTSNTYTDHVSPSLTKVYYRIFAVADKNMSDTSYADCFKLPTIGDEFQGGLISYILNPGDPGYVEGEFHGLIISPIDQGYYPWGCGGGHDYQGGLVIGTYCDDFTGERNTDLIIYKCHEETAAKICKDLVMNGYDDWYLPTINELILAYNNLYLKGLGNFSSTDDIKFYWSCQEFCGGGYENTHAHGFVFGPWYQDNSWKMYALKVRAARSF